MMSLNSFKEGDLMHSVSEPRLPLKTRTKDSATISWDFVRKEGNNVERCLAESDPVCCYVLFA